MLEEKILEASTVHQTCYFTYTDQVALYLNFHSHNLVVVWNSITFIPITVRWSCLKILRTILILFHLSDFSRVIIVFNYMTS